MSPWAVRFVSLLFFSAVIRIQILRETSNYDITFPGFCICSVSLLHWAWRAGASHPFFADWMRISLILSFLVAWYFTSQQDCMICVLWAIYIYAFKEQTALLLHRDCSLWEKVSFYLNTAHPTPVHTNIHSLTKDMILCCVLTMHIAFSADPAPSALFLLGFLNRFCHGGREMEDVLAVPCQIASASFS